MRQVLPTIRDVAREAHVAISTVSRALNGSAPTSIETRDRVAAAAARLGYHPSATARGLRRARTMTVGVVIPDLANPVFVPWIRGAEQVLQEDGYSVVIGDGQNSWASIRAQLGRFYEQRVDGLLLAGIVPLSALRPFFAAETPVEPDPRSLKPGEVVRATLEAGATEAGYRCLAELGHRRIAFITRRALGASTTMQPYRGRIERLDRVLAEAGSAPAIRIDVGGVCLDELSEMVRTLARGPRPPTAYIAGTHVLAAPLLTAIYEAGLAIPRDVSFLAFGDSEWAVAHRPPLSVIRHDYYGEAAGVARQLLARMRGDLPGPAEAVVSSEFVFRLSIGPVRLD